MKSESGKILFNLPEHRVEHLNVQLLRIILDSGQTRIDLGYQATPYYIRGGWVRISEQTFIRIKPDSTKLKITGAENIPLGKTKHNFKTSKDWLYFSLCFPPIPLKTCTIDLIEKEPTDGTDFNIYDISLNLSKAVRIGKTV